ncbi:MAG: hypothetical protein ACLUSP_03365 [Christensenellales bacterium]
MQVKTNSLSKTRAKGYLVCAVMLLVSAIGFASGVVRVAAGVMIARAISLTRAKSSVIIACGVADGFAVFCGVASGVSLLPSPIEVFWFDSSSGYSRKL